MDNKMNYELKIRNLGDTDYKICEVYENTTIEKAYACALENIKKYPNVEDWYLNF